MIRRLLSLAAGLFLLGASLSAQPGSPTPLRVSLLAAVTAGTSIAQDVRAYPNVAIYFSGAGTTSGGTLAIETSDVNDSAVTWSNVVTLNASDVSGGKVQFYALPSPVAYGYVRVRVATSITGGGTVTAVLRAN